MKTKERKHGLKIRITSILFVVILICVFAVLFSVFFFLSAQKWNGIKNEAYIAMEKATAYIDSEIDSYIQSSISIMTNDELLALLSTDYGNSMEKKLDSSMKINNYLETISAGDESKGGAIYIYTDDTNIYKTRYIYDLSAMPDAEIINKLKELPLSGIVWNKEQTPFVFYRMIDASEGHTYILRMQMPSNLINSVMKSNEKFHLTLNDDNDGNNFVYESELIGGTILKAVIPNHIRNSIFITNILIFLALYLIVIIAVSFMVKIIANRMTKELYAFLDDISDENLMDNFGNIEHQSYSEFEKIKNKIVDLLTEIKKLYEDAEALNKEKKAAELEVMQTKFNPHLLYNTLSVLKWKLLQGVTDDTIELVEILAEYYRFVLRNDTVVKLKDEVKFTEKYVRLRQMIRPENINFSVMIDETLEDFELIKLTLQPLVENSIFHGKSKNVGIRARQTDEYVEIIVMDDGYGIEQDKIAEIYSNDYKSEHKNFGIHNTRNRLFLFYGKNNFDFKIKSKPGKYTEVQLCVKK